MLTQCPSCQTTFRVTSEILRVAHGQVRCGRCQTQFDAVERLIEEPDSEESGSARFIRTEAPTQIEVEEPEAQEDITLEGRHIEITGTYRVMDDPDDLQIRQEVTEEWVEIDDADDVEASVDGIDDSEDDVAADIDLPTEENEEEESIAAAESEQDRFVRRLAGQRQRIQEVTQSDHELSLLARERMPQTELAWKLLAVPLALLLVTQVIHHYRSDLARSSGLGTPVMRLYGALGMHLTPDWQLHAYEIKQWGVLSDPAHPGTLKVRASITNRAGFPQPYPLLKLVLENRWGDQVRAREFEPREYLDPGTPTNRLLAPGQPTNATVNIVDPGPDAEGFRFDVCLRGKGAAAVCAAEVPQ